MNVPRSVAMHWFPRENDGVSVDDPRADTERTLRNDEHGGNCTQQSCHEAPIKGGEGMNGDYLIWGVILWGVVATVLGLGVGRWCRNQDVAPERINHDEG